MGETSGFPYTKSKADLVHQMERLRNKRCCHRTVAFEWYPGDGGRRHISFRPLALWTLPSIRPHGEQSQWLPGYALLDDELRK